MINEAANKGMGASKEAQENEYHFSGSGEYLPQTIKAKSLQEAEAQYIKSRIAINAKVEEPKEIKSEE